jgi:hypothetical protein
MRAGMNRRQFLESALAIGPAALLHGQRAASFEWGGFVAIHHIPFFQSPWPLSIRNKS